MQGNQQNFSYTDLTIDFQLIYNLLGSTELPLPEPFGDYLQRAIDFAAEQKELSAAWQILENSTVDSKSGSISAEGFRFNVGKTVARELKGAEKLIFFVCSAGKALSDQAAGLAAEEDSVLAYIYDLLGTAVVEAIGEKMHAVLKEQLSSEGFNLTNRYSPGYCEWSVEDQPTLFSLFPDQPCGVSLTDSALMSPVKSISGVIGIGKEVKFREYPCALCFNVTCVYRRINLLNVNIQGE